MPSISLRIQRAVLHGCAGSYAEVGEGGSCLNETRVVVVWLSSVRRPNCASCIYSGASIAARDNQTLTPTYINNNNNTKNKNNV